MAPGWTERTRRLWAATEARALGHGGLAFVMGPPASPARPSSAGCGNWKRPRAGDAPLAVLGAERVRRAGGGRTPAIVRDPMLLADLDALVEPTAAGDPTSPLRWTVKSTRTLATA